MMKLRRSLLPLAACAVASFFLSVPALGQETTGSLQGTVSVKSDRSPLPGAAVEAIHVKEAHDHVRSLERSYSGK